MPATGEPGYVVPGALRGNVTIAPDHIWTDRASVSGLQAVSRETDQPVRRAHELGTYETVGPVTELHMTCALCGQSVLCLSPDITGESYTITVADQLAGILRHLRECHDDGVAS